MYKLSVPIMNKTLNRKNRDEFLSDIQKCGAERVFLAIGEYLTVAEERENMLKELSDNCRFFKDNGFEVGAWLWKFMTVCVCGV